MAIDAYVGLPGHGKSYGVVQHVIVPSLKQNRHVVTNIPLNADLLLAEFGGTIQQLPDDWFELEDLSEYTVPGAVVVLDELWRRWPSGMLTNQASVQDKSLLAEHRHRVDDKNQSMRIVLVTQDLSQIANWVRVLVETTYRVSKKSKKLYVVSIYQGAVTGHRPPKTALLRQTSGKFSKEVYAYYSSATQSQTGDVGDESTADGRASILKSWGLWFLVGITVLCLLIGVYAVSKFFASPEEPDPIPEPVKQQPVKRAPPVAAIATAYKEVVKPSEPPLSVLWRVAGYVRLPVKRSTFENDLLGLETPKVVERVALKSQTKTRFISIDECQFYPNGIDLYCDVEGERITPWSGSGAITSVYQQQPDLTR